MIATLLAAGTLATATALPAFSTEPRSSSAGSGRQAEVSQLATGCHERFDRFVVRTRFALARYDVRYVRRIVADGSGKTVRLEGRRRLRILIRNGRAHTSAGAPLVPNVRTPRCATLRQVKLAGDFEGVVTFGLGLRARTGFRVFRLPGPQRLVVDVAR
jgi:hypothetical protein